MTFEWHICNDGSFERPLTGGEKIFYALETTLDGHSELTATVSFGIDQDKSKDDIMMLLQQAWVTMHGREPAIGLSFDSEGTHLRYQPSISSGASGWLNDHFKIVDAIDGQHLFQSVISQALCTPGRGACLHVAFHPSAEGSMMVSVSLQISHVICDGFAVMALLDRYLDILANAWQSSQDSDEALLSRLPVSLGFAYNEKFQPTDIDEERSKEYWKATMSVHSKASAAVGDTSITPQQRPHQHQSERIFLDKEQVKSLKTIAKTIGVHVFSLIMTAYLSELLSSHGLYSDSANGVKVNVPLGTHTWIDGRQQDQRGPVLCAPLAGLLWVPSMMDTSNQSLIKTTKVVQRMITEQSSVSQALHPAGVDIFVDAFNNALKATGDSFPPAYPGASYAGSTPIRKQYKGTDLSFTCHFIRTNSRARNNRPFFVVLGVWDELSLEVMYNQKYYDGDRLQGVLKRTKARLLTLKLDDKEARPAHL